MTVDLARWTPIYHITGCRKPAFFRDGRPYEGDTLTDRAIRFPDGRELDPVVDQVARCGSCGQALAMDDLACPP